MTLTYPEAIRILREHNRWRRDEDEHLPQPDPKLIGEAIDCVCAVAGPDTTTMPNAQAVALVRLARAVEDVLDPREGKRPGVTVINGNVDCHPIARAWLTLQRAQRG